ncbi:Trypanosome variant surface glycoprotein (A-type) [Trypanosoma brucei equiperdum]|uniref:Trypanosome variant surface glycoprotein (A-type) n=2 Tax=Trypanosoma brucei TaxID=5691 RepID=A0A3L6KZP2_9TRYP|nr:variant surface glycoprotein 1125.5235 [Trypanosoma brucei]RHW68407.1 Trypanosome variant surface glycoprotein (A-type) [Trypanosoma brucei equiperdum]
MVSIFKEAAATDGNLARNARMIGGGGSNALQNKLTGCNPPAWDETQKEKTNVGTALDGIQTSPTVQAGQDTKGCQLTDNLNGKYAASHNPANGVEWGMGLLKVPQNGLSATNKNGKYVHEIPLLQNNAAAIKSFDDATEIDDPPTFTKTEDLKKLISSRKPADGIDKAIQQATGATETKKGEPLTDEIKGLFGDDCDDANPAFLKTLNDLKITTGTNKIEKPILEASIDDIRKQILNTITDVLQPRPVCQSNKKDTAVVPPKITETDETCGKKSTAFDCIPQCKVIGEGTNKKCVKDPNYTPKQVEGGEKKLTKCSDATMREECKNVPGTITKDKKVVCGWIEVK